MITIDKATQNVLQAVEALNKAIEKHNETIDNITDKYLHSLKGPWGPPGPPGLNGRVTSQSLIEAVRGMTVQEKIEFRNLLSDTES